MVKSLIGLFAFRSNLFSKVYQHRSRNGGILEVAWSTGSLRKNSKRHLCWGVNTRSISAICYWNMPESNTRPMYITIAEAMVNECEGRIEKSVPRIAVWHHAACRVMKNGDPEGPVFLPYPHTNNVFSKFFAHHCFYAPNFGKVEGAYCFRLVRVSVRASVTKLLRYSIEISYMDSSSKNNGRIFFCKSGLYPFVELCPF